MSSAQNLAQAAHISAQLARNSAGLSVSDPAKETRLLAVALRCLVTLLAMASGDR